MITVDIISLYKGNQTVCFCEYMQKQKLQWLAGGRLYHLISAVFSLLVVLCRNPLIFILTVGGSWETFI